MQYKKIGIVYNFFSKKIKKILRASEHSIFPNFACHLTNRQILLCSLAFYGYESLVLVVSKLFLTFYFTSFGGNREESVGFVLLK